MSDDLDPSTTEVYDGETLPVPPPPMWLGVARRKNGHLVHSHIANEQDMEAWARKVLTNDPQIDIIIVAEAAIKFERSSPPITKTYLRGPNTVF
jgi:hypothetical protein